VRLSKPPTVILAYVLFRDIPVTATEVLLTVTAQVSVKPPSMVVILMSAIPTLMPVTTPPCDTVAIVGALLLHVTLLFVAEAGSTLANKVSVPPTVILVDALFRDTPVTALPFVFPVV
jgi:hypothetical protein